MVEEIPKKSCFDSAEAATAGARMIDYAILLKPRVMSLVVFSGLTGLVMAPGDIEPLTGFLAVLFIALGAGAAGTLNMWYDRDIDAHMTRTRNRPIPAGRIKPERALWFGIALAVLSVVAMILLVNAVAGILLGVTIAYYVILYTIWLKRRTPFNIVIGGASGAFPPMIGWAAATGGVDMGSWILFAIIFMWTPPHFWSLALFRSADYKNAGVPMLPVVAGAFKTKRQILSYSILLVPITLLPLAVGMSGWFYGAGAVVLNGFLLYHATKVWRDEDGTAARPMFLFSNLYLFLIFAAMLVDKGISAYVM